MHHSASLEELEKLQRLIPQVPLQSVQESEAPAALGHGVRLLNRLRNSPFRGGAAHARPG